MTSCGPTTPYLDVSIKNKMLYAQLHQYDFRWMVETFTLRPISQWGKMVPILEGLGGGRNIVAGEEAVKCQYEWIIWFDCDSLVARYEHQRLHLHRVNLSHGFLTLKNGHGNRGSGWRVP